MKQNKNPDDFALGWIAFMFFFFAMGLFGGIDTEPEEKKLNWLQQFVKWLFRIR